VRPFINCRNSYTQSARLILVLALGTGVSGVKSLLELPADQRPDMDILSRAKARRSIPRWTVIPLTCCVGMPASAHGSLAMTESNPITAM
jgi:hypothetical protein